MCNDTLHSSLTLSSGLGVYVRLDLWGCVSDVSVSAVAMECAAYAVHEHMSCTAAGEAEGRGIDCVTVTLCGTSRRAKRAEAKFLAMLKVDARNQI